MANRAIRRQKTRRSGAVAEPVAAPVAGAPSSLQAAPIGAAPAHITAQPWRQDAVVQLNRRHGNQVAQRTLGAKTLQRDGPNGGAAAPSAPAAAPAAAVPPASWRMPFDLGSVSTHEQARENLFQVTVGLVNLMPNSGEPRDQELSDLADELRSWAEQFQSPGPITASEARSLNGFTADYERVYNARMADTRARIRAGLDSLDSPPPDTTATEQLLAEELHNAFVEGAQDRVGAIRQSLERLAAYTERINQVATWAGRAKAVLGEVRFLNQLERLGTVHSIVEKVQNVATAARALATISGLDNQAAGGDQNDLNRFEAAIDLIDVAMPLASGVPLVGQLWSSYYAPVTRACIRLLRQIARASDLQGRQLALLDWWDRRTPGDRPPRISPELERYFPGGQPVLDFMYPLVNDGDARVSSAVEQFFLQHRSMFNVRQESWNQLEEHDNSDWYNPFSWGNDNSAPNLLPWAQRNRNHIWSMLYGNLPHTLR